MLAPPSVHERIYRSLLYAYPEEFRREYGAQLVQVFRDSYQEISHAGWREVMRLWSETLGDLASTAFAEHMGVLWQDLRYGVRTLIKNPSFTIVAVLALALGIGSTTAIFSVVNAVLLKPLPYQEPTKLVQVRSENPSQVFDTGVVAALDFIDWRKQNETLSGIALYANRAYNTRFDGEAERLRGAGVSAGLFEVLGVRPALGRGFTLLEEKAGSDQVVVLSHRLWERRFDKNPAVLGKTVVINARSYTVVGVMPPTFQFPNADTEMWAPFPFDSPGMQERGNHSYHVVGRLKPGVSLAQASAQLNVVARQLEKQYPDTNSGYAVALVPLYEQVVKDVRPALLTLVGAVASVLLIACANVANLLLARAATRSKEIAIRTALGASRARLVRQLLTESVLLALLGGAAGFVLAYWGVDLLIALSPKNLPRIQEIGIDGQVLGFTLLVALATGVLFGLVPALQASRTDTNETLKDGGRGSSGGKAGLRVRNLLVVGEVALALVLLVTAGLLIQSFVRLQSVSPGFNPQNVLSAQLTLPLARYKEDRQQIAFFDQVLGRIRTLPGARMVSAVATLPLSGNSASLSFNIEGRPEARPGKADSAGYLVIGPDYLQTMGIPLIRGRDLSLGDTPTTRRVALINQTFARRYFPGQDPIGKRLTTSDLKEGKWALIVGVVGDIKHEKLEDKPRPEIYLPYTQAMWPTMSILVRTATAPESLTAALRAQVAAVDPDQPVGMIRTMEQVVSESIAQPRFNTLLIASFATIALVLAAVGIYGVMAYSVNQRTHEIGIRMALGAAQKDILGLVVGQGMLLALSGVAIGAVAAFAITRVLESLLYGVSAADPATFAFVAVILVTIALVACYLPARRATRVDPMIALRHE